MLRELTWGEDNKISNACTERFLGEKPMIRFNYEKYNMLLLLSSIQSSPVSPLDEKAVADMPKSLGEHLFLIATKLNTVSPEDQRTFLQTLDSVNTQTR